MITSRTDETRVLKDISPTIKKTRNEMKGLLFPRTKPKSRPKSFDEYKLDKQQKLEIQNQINNYSIERHNGYYCLFYKGKRLPKELSIKVLFDSVDWFRIECRFLIDPRLKDPLIKIENGIVFFEGDILPFVKKVKKDVFTKKHFQSGTFVIEKQRKI